MPIRTVSRLPAAWGVAMLGIRASARHACSGSHRAFVTRARPLPSALTRSSLRAQQSFRRSLADAAAPAKRKRFPFFRWAWRLTYISVIGGVGLLAFQIYELRHPSEQREPDPNKKTLVVLGRPSPKT